MKKAWGKCECIGEETSEDEDFLEKNNKWFDKKNNMLLKKTLKSWNISMDIVYRLLVKITEKGTKNPKISKWTHYYHPAMQYPDTGSRKRNEIWFPLYIVRYNVPWVADNWIATCTRIMMRGRTKPTSLGRLDKLPSEICTCLGKVGQALLYLGFRILRMPRKRSG